jgi:hypothetical protein
MHSVSAKPDVSDAVAAFMVAPHRGVSYDNACAKAGPLLDSALALDQTDIHEPKATGYIRRGALHAQYFFSQPALAPVAAILGATLAPAIRYAADTDAMISAIACGRELQSRIHRSVGTDAFDRIWLPGSAIGIFGAVCAAVRILRLDHVQARDALGIVATQSAGLAAVAGDASESLLIGKAAADAVEAAVLARNGFTSSAASIEGRRGFAALMATAFDARVIIDGLGVDWA